MLPGHGYFFRASRAAAENFTGAAEFSIDPGSIKINDEIEDGMKVAFPIGCVVVDQASGTEYTVTNATNVDKKENIIEGILDGILENSDAAKK